MPRPRITEPFSGGPRRRNGELWEGVRQKVLGTGGSDGPVFDAGQRMLGPQETGCAIRPHSRLLFKGVPQGLTSAQRTCAGERQRQAGGYPHGGSGAWSWASRVAIKFSQLCSTPTRPVMSADRALPGPGALAFPWPEYRQLPAGGRPRAATPSLHSHCCLSGRSHRDETNAMSSCIYSRKINICFVRHLKWALIPMTP